MGNSPVATEHNGRCPKSVCKVQVNEERVKPANAVAVGNRLSIQMRKYQCMIEVLALSAKRGSAPEALNCIVRLMKAVSATNSLPH
jgi:ribosomal 50S subunit-recycling heat shock protein